MVTPERAVEDEIKLATKTAYRPDNFLKVRPCAGNGAVISTTAKIDIWLTVEERKRVAQALWPDAFKEE